MLAGGFAQCAVAEAFAHRGGAGTGEELFQRINERVAQGEGCAPVEAAGEQGAVGQQRELVRECKARAGRKLPPLLTKSPPLLSLCTELALVAPLA